MSDIKSIELGRRSFIKTTTAGALLASLGEHVLAQAAKIENLKIITGYAPGGTSDTTCRHLSTKLAPLYANNAVVENRTGAGGQIAIQYLTTQPADGTVALQTPTSMLTVYPHIFKKLPYDPVNDLAPVSIICVFDYGFAVGPLVPLSVKTIADFQAWAKANPQNATFGSPAAGSTPHFVGVLVGRLGGVELRHAAYRGTQPAMLDLLGGNIAAVSGPIGDINQHIHTGKVRLLGTSGSKRSRFAPSIPTMAEQGFKDMVHSEWFAFFLPAKTPPEIVNALNAALKTALNSKEVLEGLTTFGLEAMHSSPAELAELLRKDTAKWGPIVKQVGFTADS